LNSELSLAKADQRKHGKRHGEVDPGIPVTDENCVIYQTIKGAVYKVFPATER